MREPDSNQLINLYLGFPISLKTLVFVIAYVDTASIVGSAVLSRVRVVGALVQIMAAHLDKISSDGDPAVCHSFLQGSKQNFASAQWRKQ